MRVVDMTYSLGLFDPESSTCWPFHLFVYITRVMKTTPQKWYHGTNIRVETLNPESYLTSSLDEACMYALLRTHDKGGTPNVITVELLEHELLDRYAIAPEGDVENAITKERISVLEQATVDDIFSQLGPEMKALVTSRFQIIDITHLVK